MEDLEYLTVSVSDLIATVTLRRPPVNALSALMMREITWVFTRSGAGNVRRRGHPDRRRRPRALRGRRHRRIRPGAIIGCTERCYLTFTAPNPEATSAPGGSCCYPIMVGGQPTDAAITR
jgi:hypothetical protein